MGMSRNDVWMVNEHPSNLAVRNGELRVIARHCNTLDITGAPLLSRLRIVRNNVGSIGPAAEAAANFATVCFHSPPQFNVTDFDIDLLSVDHRTDEKKTKTTARIEYLSSCIVRRIHVPNRGSIHRESKVPFLTSHAKWGHAHTRHRNTRRHTPA